MQSKLRITPAPSNLTKYAQKTLCTKTPLSRGVTGKTFTDTEKNTKKNKTEIYPFSDWVWQPSKNNNLPIFRLVCHRQPSKKRKKTTNKQTKRRARLGLPIGNPVKRTNSPLLWRKVYARQNKLYLGSLKVKK